MKQILIFYRDKLIQSTSQMREMVSELEEHLNKEPVSSKQSLIKKINLCGAYNQ